MRCLFFCLLTYLIAILPGQAQIVTNPEEVCPLLIGQTFPDGMVQTMEGKEVPLYDLIQGKSIIIFYRGGWCPFCNRHLSAIAEIQNKITELGYTILAISPDDPEELQNTIDKQNLFYTLLSDSGGSVSQDVGIAFNAPQRQLGKIERYSRGKNPGFLPVPCLFVVDKNKEIVFEYINPNYKHRISAEMLLAVLQSL